MAGLAFTGRRWRALACWFVGYTPGTTALHVTMNTIGAARLRLRYALPPARDTLRQSRH